MRRRRRSGGPPPPLSPPQADGAGRRRRPHAAVRACALLLLPAAARAPSVPSRDAAAEAPRHLRRRGGGGSFPTRLAAYLRTAVGRDDGGDGEGGVAVGEGPSSDRGMDGEGDSEERRLQRTAREFKWYVSWYEGKCVQSCTPTPKNLHCAGNARWDQLLFNSAEQCCVLNLNWLTVEKCTATNMDPDDGPDDFNSITALGSAGVDDDRCPPVYDHRNDYVSNVNVTVYVTDEATGVTLGHVYRCRDGPLFQYCNLFPPDWSRTSYGGGSVHTTDSLGWEMTGDCEGNEIVPLMTPPEEGDPDLARPPDLDLLLVDPTTPGWEAYPVAPADVGFGLDPPLEGGGTGPASPADVGFGPDPPSDGASPSDDSASPSDDGPPLSTNLPGLTVVPPEAPPPGRPFRPLRPAKPEKRPGKPGKGGPPDYGVGGGALPPSASAAASGGVPSDDGPPSTAVAPGASPAGEGAQQASAPPPGRPFRPLRPGKPGKGGLPDFGVGGALPPSVSAAASGGVPSDGPLSTNLPEMSPPGKPGKGGPPDYGVGGGPPGAGGPPPPSSSEVAVGKKPAKPKPPPDGGRDDGGDVQGGDAGEGADADGDGDSSRPRPDRPDKPKPPPAVQVQQAPDPTDKDEDMLIEMDGIQCYRSGWRCESDAEKFACCTRCINSICI